MVVLFTIFCTIITPGFFFVPLLFNYTDQVRSELSRIILLYFRFRYKIRNLIEN